MISTGRRGNRDTASDCLRREVDTIIDYLRHSRSLYLKLLLVTSSRYQPLETLSYERTTHQCFMKKTTTDRMITNKLTNNQDVVSFFQRQSQEAESL